METTWPEEKAKIAALYNEGIAEAADIIWAMLIANFVGMDPERDYIIHITPALILHALFANGWRIDKVSPIE